MSFVPGGRVREQPRYIRRRSPGGGGGRPGAPARPLVDGERSQE